MRPLAHSLPLHRVLVESLGLVDECDAQSASLLSGMAACCLVSLRSLVVDGKTLSLAMVARASCRVEDVERDESHGCPKR